MSSDEPTNRTTSEPTPDFAIAEPRCEPDREPPPASVAAPTATAVATAAPEASAGSLPEVQATLRRLDEELGPSLARVEAALANVMQFRSDVEDLRHQVGAASHAAVRSERRLVELDLELRRIGQQLRQSVADSPSRSAHGSLPWPALSIGLALLLIAWSTTTWLHEGRRGPALAAMLGANLLLCLAAQCRGRLRHPRRKAKSAAGG